MPRSLNEFHAPPNRLQNSKSEYFNYQPAMINQSQNCHPMIRNDNGPILPINYYDYHTGPPNSSNIPAPVIFQRESLIPVKNSYRRRTAIPLIRPVSTVSNNNYNQQYKHRTQLEEKFNNQKFRNKSQYPTNEHIYDEEGIIASNAWHAGYSIADVYTDLMESQREFHNIDFYAEDTGILKNQNEITAQDRHILHHWLIKICTSQQFTSMHQEALHLCIALIDDFICKGPIPKAKFQLVGITALLLASKQLIYDAPEIQALLNLCEASCKTLDYMSPT
jgi:hypothetical protein